MKTPSHVNWVYKLPNYINIYFDFDFTFETLNINWFITLRETKHFENELNKIFYINMSM